jgi:hypothetical protein
LSTTNPTWTDLGSKPSRRGGKLATNRLSYGTACASVYFRTDVPEVTNWVMSSMNTHASEHCSGPGCYPCTKLSLSPFPSRSHQVGHLNRFQHTNECHSLEVQHSWFVFNRSTVWNSIRKLDTFRLILFVISLHPRNNCQKSIWHCVRIAYLHSLSNCF